VTKRCTARGGLLAAASANGQLRRPVRHDHSGTVTYLAPDRPGAAAITGARPESRQLPGAAYRQPSAQSPGMAGDASTVRAARDRAQGWLHGAMLALAVLAVAAAVVSWDAQYVLVRSVKHNPAVAAIEAGIPDVGALIFATLGIALALHARRAIRARILNVACVGISLAMNSLASAPGWRDVAIWVMPSAVYALASDTLIGVVRAWVIARGSHSGQTLADDEPTPMALIGASVLWLIRLAIAPVSTITGFRRWLLDEYPVAPGRNAAPAGVKARTRPAINAKQSGSAPAPRRATKPGKQAQLLALAGQRHDLAAIPLTSVSRIATSIAAEIDLAPGTARRVLLAHVRALRNGQNTGQRSHSHGTEGTS